MKGLSGADLRAISDFLREIYSLQTFDDFLGRLLAGLEKIVAVDSSVCMECGAEEDDHLVHFSVPELSLYGDRYSVWRRVCNDHPGWRRLVAEGGGTWYTVSDFLSETAYHRTGLYNELFRHVDIEENLGTLYEISPARIVGISLHRDRRSFSERDRVALQFLQPHLIQAWRNAKVAGRLYGQIRAQEETLEARNEGIVVLDARQRIRFMTARARQHVDKYFGGLGLNDLVPEKLQAWVRRQQDSQIPAPRAPLLVEGNHGSELTVTLVPHGEGVSLVMQEKALLSDLTILGLTRRESDVLLSVTRGKSNEEICILLDMSLGTVKKHLEHIFAKLGVESRTAAAMMAVSKLGELAERNSS